MQRIASPDNGAITGYEIMARRGASAADVAAAAEMAIEAAFYEDGDQSVGSAAAVTLAERYPVVFDWLKTHDVNARVILAVMMAVVLFNMASAMLIMVLDRTGMIGVLKAMGMRNGAVRRIFLYRAAMLFVRGAAWGNAVGLALVGLQAWLAPVKLDPEGYMLSELPVRIDVWWLAALNAGAVAVTVAVMTLPSMIVARISPESSLKYRQ
ncbi:MAG: FtsX-like permease family protein [Alistipes sp.]|nr:FtsX-like permease family protein [Alistipes sp.]